MVRKIFVASFFFMIQLEAIHGSPTVSSPLAIHSFTYGMKENAVNESSQEQLKEVLTAWKAFVGAYAKRSTKKDDGAALVALLIRVRTLVKKLPQDLYSHKDIVTIYKTRSTLLQNGTFDKELDSLLADGWSQMGSFYLQTITQGTRKRYMTYGQIKGDPVAKKLFADETTSDTIPSTTPSHTSFDESIRDSSPTQESINEAAISISSNGQVVKSQSEGASRLKMFGLGAALGLAGYLCILKAFPSATVSSTLA